MAKSAWLVPNNFVVFEQDFAWEGHNATEYMYWNVTAVRGDITDIHFSHGANVSSAGVISLPRTDIDVTFNITSRETYRITLKWF